MFIILTLIVLVAALNIISGLIMLVKDKTHDIAILRTMGATRGAVMRIFLIIGASIGVAGTLAGFMLGLVLANNLEAIRTFLNHLLHAEPVSGGILFPVALAVDRRSARGVALVVAHDAGAVDPREPSIRPGGRDRSIPSKRCATNERMATIAGARSRRASTATIARATTRLDILRGADLRSGRGDSRWR